MFLLATIKSVMESLYGPANLIFSNDVHPLNAFALIDVTFFGMVIDVNEPQFKNADSPIDVTFLGE